MSWRWWRKKEKCGTCPNYLDKDYGEILVSYSWDNKRNIQKVKICSSCVENLEKSRVQKNDDK